MTRCLHSLLSNYLFLVARVVIAGPAFALAGSAGLMEGSSAVNADSGDKEVHAGLQGC